MPRGGDVFHDIRCAFPDHAFEEIFDVGAFDGGSAMQFIKAHPNARLTCFEPTEDSFALLCSKMRPYSNVRCVQMGVGAFSGSANLIIGEQPYMNRLERENAQNSEGEDSSVAVNVTTLDDFCRENAVKHISFLKVDAEGWDLDVLKGGSSLLENGLVDWVQVEAGMNPENRVHVPMEAFKSHLEALRYRLFGVYEQVHEWPTDQAHLRRANLVFASPTVLKSGKG